MCISWGTNLDEDGKVPDADSWGRCCTLSMNKDFEQKCPELARRLVYALSLIHILYELLGELKHTHVMQLPPGSTGVKALEFWKAEVVDIKEEFERFYGIEITDEKIREAIKLRNRERKAVLDFFEVGRLKQMCIRDRRRTGQKPGWGFLCG